MPNQLGIAILGCGYWGINYVRVFSELPESRVVVVCDPRPDRLQEVDRRFPGVILTTEVESASSLDGVDAAVVFLLEKIEEQSTRIFRLEDENKRLRLALKGA